MAEMHLTSANLLPLTHLWSQNQHDLRSFPVTKTWLWPIAVSRTNESGLS